MNFPVSKVKINYVRHAILFRQKSRASERGGKENAVQKIKLFLLYS